MYFPFLIADCLRALVLQSGPDFPLLSIPQALVFPLALSSSVMIVNIQDGEEECEMEGRRTWRMTSQSALVVSNLGLPNCIDMIQKMFINVIFYRIINICKDKVIFQKLCP